MHEVNDEYKFLLNMGDYLYKTELPGISKDDREYLAEFLLSEARSNVRELKSRLTNLLYHMLKAQHIPELFSRSWIKTIHENIMQINDLLDGQPSLKREVENLLPKCFNDAKILFKDTAKTPKELPEDCPWPAEQCIDNNYIDSFIEKCKKASTSIYYKG